MKTYLTFNITCQNPLLPTKWSNDGNDPALESQRNSVVADGYAAPDDDEEKIIKNSKIIAEMVC
jgi:hypothetical protein